MSTVRILRGAAVAAALVIYRPAVSIGQQVDSLRGAGSGAPDSVAAVLGRAGYSAVPLQWSGKLFLDAKFDTVATSLLLDSGMSRDLSVSSSFPGVHVRDMKFQSASAWNMEDVPWGTVDRVVVGPLTLTSLEGTLSEGPAPAKGSLGGVIGAPVLNRQGAIVDYETHTLYLLPAPARPEPARRAVPARARTLRAALEAAGQYRTFLTLMREAGLMPLLDGAGRRNSKNDSVAWSGFRTQAYYEAGADTMSESGARYARLRQGMNGRLRRSGQRTVFVPTDAAFAQLSPDTLRAWRADRARLAEVLRAHVLANVYLDTLVMRTLVRGVSQPAGSTIGFHPMGARIDVDRLASLQHGRVLSRATIVEPDLAAANGVAHGIDRLLIPAAAAASPLAAALAGQGYTAVPLFRLPNGYFALRAKVDTATVMLVLDTGSEGGVTLDKALAWRVFDLDNYEPPVGEVIPFVLDSVVMPPVELSTVDLVFINQKSAFQNLPPIEGLLGSQLLNRYHARVDYATGMLYLRLPANAQAARPAPPKKP